MGDGADLTFTDDIWFSRKNIRDLNHLSHLKAVNRSRPAMTVAKDPIELSAEILKALEEPFPLEVVKWRTGSTNKRNWKEGDKRWGMALAYIDARIVRDRLNDVCGAFWQSRHIGISASIVGCEVGIMIAGDWLWRSDGAGGTDVETEKGAMSDAFKRAAVMWGVGRYLYNVPSKWVELDEKWQIPRAALDGLYGLLEDGAAITAGEEQEPEPSAHAARQNGGDAKFAAHVDAMRACKNVKALATYWKTTVTPDRKTMPGHWYQQLAEEKDACKLALEAQAPAAAAAKPAPKGRQQARR